ncbi:N-acetyltransferase family protein [Deinococcus sp.]|uniref:GNAT family N-acetyltransferase n=1 Tax=Deinococcus sp. TaxID=47478 RepID=UPI003CC6CBCF
MSDLALIVRPATAADAAQIAAVHIQSWHETYAGLLPPSYLERMTGERMLELRRANWRLVLQGGVQGSGEVVRVATLAGRVLAFASGGSVRPHPVIPGDYSAEVYTLYALREGQGRGLGRRLLAEVAHELARRGHRGMALWVLASNPTRQFYAHLGGVELGQKSEEIQGGALSEVALGWRRLESLY